MPEKPRKSRPRRVPSVRPKKPGSYHHGDLRRTLVDAALHLVERDGPGGVTLRGAARLAGVSQTAPYRHFADKEALLAAVAEQGFRSMARWMFERGPRHGADPLERMIVLGAGYVTFATEHPSQFRVMFGSEVADKTGYPPLQKAADDAFSILTEAVAAAQRADMLREGDPREMALAAWSAVHGLSLLLVDGQAQAAGWGESTPAQLAQRVGRSLLAGLARSDPPN